MARTKQATPLRRDPSSEYFTRETTGTPSRSPGSWDNEKSNGATNGHANGSAAKSSAPAKKRPARCSCSLLSVVSTPRCKVSSCISFRYVYNADMPLKSHLGSPPRALDDDAVWTRERTGTLQIPRLPQHRPVALRRDGGLPLPAIRHAERRLHGGDISQPQGRHPSDPSGCHVVPGLSFWLCLSRPHRLYHLHPCQVVQAPPGHVPAHHALPKTISSV